MVARAKRIEKRAGRRPTRSSARRLRPAGRNRQRHVGRRKRARPWPLADLRGLDGCAALLIVGEPVAGRRDLAQGSVTVRAAGAGATVGRGVSKSLAGRACAAFAALGHAARMVVLRKLLAGPATYRALQRATRMKAGPLYHHINQLRLAGLLLPKQRDLYELTRGGRNVLLAAAVIVAVAGDRRPRPVAPG